jgi:shikimate dehydrogenase
MTTDGRPWPWWPTAASTVVGVVGDPVDHSWSPILHQAAFDAMGLDWVSVGFRVTAGRLPEALIGMRSLGIAGLSVTMPHKTVAAGAVDRLTPLASRLGAVNCIVSREGELVGESTDGAGFLASVSRGAGFSPPGQRCVVVGAGGAARAVIVALAEAGAEEVVVINRTFARAKIAAELAGPAGRVGSPGDIAQADLIVQATPMGMGPSASGDAGLPFADLPFDGDLLHPGQVVVDLVYHPAVTPLLAEATRRGATAVGGMGMLVHQAALAIEAWTGQPAPVEAMWTATGQVTR